MCHTSPTSFLLFFQLGTFLVFHLWSFDRFKCLRWGESSGTFKRVMTYSYLVTIPLIGAYSIGFAIIKYREGYVQAAFIGIVPKPYMLWDDLSKSAIFPLMLLFSVGWSLEMVTHLEELCFWLFLVNAAANQQDWFKSLYFRTWVVGSICAVIYMPLVTIFTRSDPLRSEAFTFLAGSLGSMCLTVWFLPILWMFPNFLANLKREGVDGSTIIRLTKFHELNTIRVLFRFLFVAPLLVLGVDGVKPHTHEINETPFWTDLLAIIAAFGCAISSALTLVIFFPRSIEGELAAKDQRKWTRSLKATLTQHTQAMTESRGTSISDGLSLAPSRTSAVNIYPPMSAQPLGKLPSSADRDVSFDKSDLNSPDKVWSDVDDAERADTMGNFTHLPSMRPNRRLGSDIELGGMSPNGSTTPPSNTATPRRGRMSRVNPLVHNFTSPIDLMSGGTPSNGSRLTFTRPS
ncbi:hypothetical protein DL96DRAFT_1119389 [Flagelloscypha sp. PMI_526]|nr:hypothetical protein DL96DRAFT_1119389 [Flagelloscypha sp. PMI_526]